MNTYSIGTVARLTGLEVATIRNWQNRYALVVPRRDTNGRRRYTRDQLDQLRLLKGWRDDGFSAADAHERLAAELGPQRAVEQALSSRRRAEIVAAGVAARAEARELRARASWLCGNRQSATA